MEMSDELLTYVIQDLKKKELSMIARGNLIDEYMKRRNISINEASKELGIPKTTAHTYHRFAELGEDKYNTLIAKGFKPSDIQKELKNGSTFKFTKKEYEKRIDIILDSAKSSLMEFVHRKDYSIETAQKIRELINILNRISMRVEKND